MRWYSALASSAPILPRRAFQSLRKFRPDRVPRRGHPGDQVGVKGVASAFVEVKLFFYPFIVAPDTKTPDLTPVPIGNGVTINVGGGAERRLRNSVANST